MAMMNSVWFKEPDLRVSAKFQMVCKKPGGRLDLTKVALALSPRIFRSGRRNFMVMIYATYRSKGYFQVQMIETNSYISFYPLGLQCLLDCLFVMLVIDTAVELYCSSDDYYLLSQFQ
jgi:hypothetical protein